MSAQTVEMYIDPACPWAWLTSRWLFEAEKVRSFTVVTKVFSLAEVNRARKEFHEHLEALARPPRVLVAARRVGGEAAIRAVYTEMGEAHHERNEPLSDETLRAAVTAAGLDPSLVSTALSDDDVQAAVLAEHAAVADRGAFGVPTLSVDGSPAYFGPIVDRRISGEEAGRLWDIALPLLLHPHVFELKRARTSEPDTGRSRIRREAAVASA
jgi:predicted DsbA family dithiol-disulfide isomerase